MKTIFITKFIKRQKELNSNIKIINGSINTKERIKTYNDFNEDIEINISITESIVLLGGIRYNKNNNEIKIVFLDDIDDDKKRYILSRMNIN